MVIPDWLVNLLQKWGLLSSEPQRIEQKIAKLEDETWYDPFFNEDGFKYLAKKELAILFNW